MKISTEIINELTQIVGAENSSTDIAELYTYASDASVHQSLPDIVLRSETIEQVSKIMKLANDNKVPVTPRGSGSSLSGNAVPVEGGIVLDIKQMNKILEIRIEDLYVRVEAGVINDDLNAALAKDGFFFPPTPASGKVATIGGMVANNASGMRAGKYGATREAVMGLKVVMADGEIIDTGTRTLKNSSGYHLDKLFIGSEGTLGVVVEAILKITPKPQSRAIAVASFDTLEKAGQAVANIMATGLMPSGMEIMDKVCIDAVEKATQCGLPACEALLLIEADGHPVVVKEDIEKMAEVCKETGATKVDSTTDEKRMTELWSARKALLPSLSRAMAGWASMSLADDMDVPLSKVPETAKAFQEIAKKHEIIIGTYGHASTGNLHTKVLFNPKSEDHWQRAHKAVGEIYDKVIEVGGTVSGEHGIALSKAPYMKIERENSLETMRKIKKVLDPNNILNPRKIMDAPDNFVTATDLRYPIKEE
ncbi:MAG: FAD-binding protein [Thermoplasmata archaeon]|nr:FAD-binding protein [Thermoplasmata archaeon]